MRRLLNFLLVLGIAVVTQWAIIKYAPNVIYKIAVRRSNHPVNQWVNANKTDAAMRQVVLPNPDFIYSALFYDVNSKDLVLTGLFPDSVYASLAFYDDRCQPYYVYNNMASHRKGPFWFTLTRWGRKEANYLQAKTNKGVIICRFLVKNGGDFEKMKAYQQKLSGTMR
jgi:hypothetical protein